MANSFDRAFMGAAGSGGDAEFAISPAGLMCATTLGTWNFADDGDLILGGGGNTVGGYNAGQVFIITVTNRLSVNIDIWGGGAASGWYFTTYQPGGHGPGGGGGHTTADVVLNPGDYTLQLGAMGSSFPVLNTLWPSTTRANYVAGGVPTNVTWGYCWGTEGAGYTGLFKGGVGTASWYTAMLIAGGGGGGGSPGYGGYGGAGGGASGQDSNGGNQSGKGGTQSAGGAPSIYNNASVGTQLHGGWSQNWGYASLGGGGGGYWGGGGGNVGGGGGGSGYIDTSDSDITNAVTTAGSNNTPGDSSNSRRTAGSTQCSAPSSANCGAGGTSGMGHGGRVYMSAN